MIHIINLKCKTILKIYNLFLHEKYSLVWQLINCKSRYIPVGSIISFRGVAGYHICCKTEGPRFETGRKHASILGLFASKRRQWKEQKIFIDRIVVINL